MNEQLIPATEFCLPNGRQRATNIPLDADTYSKAKAMYNAGYRFEYEFLRENALSCTIADKMLGADVGGMVHFYKDTQRKTTGQRVIECMSECIDQTYLKWVPHSTLAGSPWP